MTKAEILFHQIADKLPNGAESKMFGALCIKATNGKASAIFWKGDMIFKLNSADSEKALMLKGTRQGTHLYAPERQMKGWVVIPFIHSSKWTAFAKKSIAFVQPDK